MLRQRVPPNDWDLRSGRCLRLSSTYKGAADTDVFALSKSTVVEIDVGSLSSVSSFSSDLTQALWREMALELGLAAAWTINLGVRPALQRIAHLACELAARFGLAGHDECGVEWPGTQAGLAAATGLSVVHVNRVLSRLVANKILANSRSMLIRDMARLRDVASFDNAYLRVFGERLGSRLLASSRDLSQAMNGGQSGIYNS